MRRPSSFNLRAVTTYEATGYNIEAKKAALKWLFDNGKPHSYNIIQDTEVQYLSYLNGFRVVFKDREHYDGLMKSDKGRETIEAAFVEATGLPIVLFCLHEYQFASRWQVELKNWEAEIKEMMDV